MILKLVLHSFDPGVELRCFVGSMSGCECLLNVFVVHILVQGKSCDVREEVEI